MGIKIKNRDPKSTDFASGDIIINIKEGTLFYKSDKSLFKLQGDNVNTKDTTEFLPDNLIKGNLSVSGSIIPLGSGSFDLGSPTNPWKDLHITTESIKFYDGLGEVGKIQFERGEGIKIRDNDGNFGTFSSSLIQATTRIKSPQANFTGLTASMNGGFF